jgi:hypothetical protein
MKTQRVGGLILSGMRRFRLRYEFFWKARMLYFTRRCPMGTWVVMAVGSIVNILKL